MSKLCVALLFPFLMACNNGPTLSDIKLGEKIDLKKTSQIPADTAVTRYKEKDSPRRIFEKVENLGDCIDQGKTSLRKDVISTVFNTEVICGNGREAIKLTCTLKDPKELTNETMLLNGGYAKNLEKTCLRIRREKDIDAITSASP